jgi:hypothetical protein
MLTARQLRESCRALDAAQYSYPDAMIAELGCLYDGACAAVTLEEMQQVADCGSACNGPIPFADSSWSSRPGRMWGTSFSSSQRQLVAPAV